MAITAGEIWIPDEALAQAAAELLRQRRAVTGKGIPLAEALGTIEGFINGFCWARNEQRGEAIKVREWPGQSKLREAFENHRRVIGLKARGVGWTWELTWLTLWIMGQPDKQVLYMCQRQQNAYNFVRRVKWARARVALACQYPEIAKDGDAASHLRLANGSEIYAMPRDPDALHYYHPALIIVDEWARIEQEVLPAITGATGFEGNIIGLSTAKGALGEFYNVYRDAMAGGSEAGFFRVFSPWQDCPEYQERPDAGSRKQTSQEYPEYEEEAFIETAPGEAVYPEFSTALHVSPHPLTFRPDRPILRAWDFGRQACLWSQLREDGHWWILRELHLGQVATRAMGQKVLQLSAMWFPGARYLDLADPIGVARRGSEAQSDYEVLRTLGIRCQPSAVFWSSRRDAMVRWLTRLVGNSAALRIDKSCSLLLKGFQGMYRFPDRILETSSPVKDIFSDLPNCAEYTAAVLEGMVGAGSVRKRPTPRKRYGAAVTGY